MQINSLSCKTIPVSGGLQLLRGLQLWPAEFLTVWRTAATPRLSSDTLHRQLHEFEFVPKKIAKNIHKLYKYCLLGFLLDIKTEQHPFTFLLPNWFATVWHFSASSTVRVRASSKSDAGYFLSLASSNNSFNSENSNLSSSLASRADLTLSTQWS